STDKIRWQVPSAGSPVPQIFGVWLTGRDEIQSGRGSRNQDPSELTARSCIPRGGPLREGGLPDTLRSGRSVKSRWNRGPSAHCPPYPRVTKSVPQARADRSAHLIR